VKTIWLGFADEIEHVTPLDSAVYQIGHSIKWYSKQETLRHRLSHDECSVLFLKGSPNSDVYELCKEIYESHPLLTIILMLPKEKVDFKRALRVGAKDIVGLPIEHADLKVFVDELSDFLKRKDNVNSNSPESARVNGRVVTVCSTKGGVGKTTVAVNLAATLAKRKSKVAILDLDLQFGDVAIMFDEKPKRTIYEWVKEEYQHSRYSVDKIMIQHASGVDIMPSPLRPEFAEEIAADHIRVLIDELRRRYDYVFVDTPPYLTETVLLAMEESEDIIVVTCADLTTLRSSKLLLETLQPLQLKEKVKLILNRENKRRGVPYESIGDVLEAAIYARIPNEEKITLNAVNSGVPFIISHPKSKVGKSYFRLANSLFEVEKKEEVQKKGLAKMFKFMF
jgi:pilus assembly protein CpaE